MTSLTGSRVSPAGSSPSSKGSSETSLRSAHSAAGWTPLGKGFNCQQCGAVKAARRVEGGWMFKCMECKYAAFR